MWVTLNVMGPELLRVKDLARLSNSYGELDYNIALKVLTRVFVRRHHGIVIFRHAGGKEIIPSSIRLVPAPISGESSGGNVEDPTSISDDIGNYSIFRLQITRLRKTAFVRKSSFYTY